MKESLKLAVEKAKRGESEGFGTIYRETCADVYFRARLMMGNRGEARELVRQIYLVVFGLSARSRIRRRWKSGFIPFSINSGRENARKRKE